MKKLPKLWLAGMLIVGLAIGLILGGIFFSRTEYVSQNSNCQAGCFVTEEMKNYQVLYNYTAISKPAKTMLYPQGGVPLSYLDCGSGCFITSANVQYVGNSGSNKKKDMVPGNGN